MKEIVQDTVTATSKFNEGSYFLFRSMQEFKDSTGRIKSHKLLDYLMPFINTKANEYKQIFKNIVSFETDEYKSEMIVTLLEVVNELNELDHRLDFKSTYLRRCDRNIYNLVKSNTIACNLSIPKFTECMQMKESETVVKDEEGCIDLYKTELKKVYTTITSVCQLDKYTYMDNIENMQFNFDEELDNELLAEDLNKLLDTLTVREALILDCRFGLSDDKPKTLEEVGREFKISKDRVRQIEAKALRKLRHPSRSSIIRCYLE